jgi:hypothetical protein
MALTPGGEAMATTKKVKLPKCDPDAERVLLAKPIRLPGKHKGNIPAAVIRAAVKQVAAERRKRNAERAAAGGTIPESSSGGIPMADSTLLQFEHERHLIGPVLRLPGKHKGRIPASVIRASVRKVVFARKRREAAAAAAKSRASAPTG